MHQKSEITIVSYHDVFVSQIIRTSTELVHLRILNLDSDQYVRTGFTLFRTIRLGAE